MRPRRDRAAQSPPHSSAVTAEPANWVRRCGPAGSRRWRRWAVSVPLPLAAWRLPSMAVPENRSARPRAAALAAGRQAASLGGVSARRGAVGRGTRRSAGDGGCAHCRHSLRPGRDARRAPAGRRRCAAHARACWLVTESARAASRHAPEFAARRNARHAARRPDVSRRCGTWESAGVPGRRIGAEVGGVAGTGAVAARPRVDNAIRT